jgi:hypothetical protein
VGIEVINRKNTAAPISKEDGSQTLRLLQSGWSLELERQVLKPASEVEYMQTMRFEDNLLKAMMNMDINVDNAPLRKLYFKTSQPLSNLNIRGRNIASLKALDKFNWELSLKQARMGKMHFEISWQQSVKDLKLNMSSIKLKDANRQQGYVVFYAPSNVAVNFTSNKGVKKVDFRELDSLRSPLDLSDSRACFRAFTGNPNLLAELSRKNLAETLPAEIHQVDMLTQVGVDASQITKLELKMDPGTKSFLKVMLPPASRLMNVLIDDHAVRPVHKSIEMMIPLKGRPANQQEKNIVVKILYITEPTGDKVFDHFTGPAFDLPLNKIRWNLYMPEHGKYTEFSGNMKYIEAFEPAKVVSAQEIIKKNTFGRMDYMALSKKSLKKGLEYSEQGRNIEARIQLEQAVEESLGDKGMQEDARMQLNQLWRTQAQMAISNRRDNLGLTGKDLKFNTNYTLNDVRKMEQSLEEEDSTALGSIGEKIFARQRAARKRVQPLKASLPQHGKHLEFYREIMVEKSVPLEINLNSSFKVNEPVKDKKYFHLLISFCAFLSGLMIVGNFWKRVS